MSTRITLAVAHRVIIQLRRDRRTMAMLLVLPCLLITLLWWIYKDANPQLFDQIGPALLAIFPVIVMFLVTSVTTLRERSSGTLERLLAMPMGKLDFLVGYALAGALNGATLFTYISASPDLLIGTYGISPQQFGLVFGLNAAAIIGASQVNRYLLRRATPDEVLERASQAAVLASISAHQAPSAG